MKKWGKEIKRNLALVMALVLLGTSTDYSVLAAVGCECHPEHTAECGYEEGVEGSVCTHVHDEDCEMGSVSDNETEPTVSDSNSADIVLGGVTMENGDYLAVDAQEVTETKPETVGYAYYADGVLTLHDYVYEGTGYLYDEEYNYTSALYTEGVLEIALEGDSSLTNTEEEGSGITSGGNLTIRGDGSLSINAYYGIDAEEKVNLTISGGTVDIEATGYAGINMQGGDMTICDSTLNIDIDNWYGIYLEDGNLTVNDSTVDIEAAGDSGIRINSGDLTISDSIVNIDSEYTSGVLLDEGKLTVSGADAEVAVKSNGYAIQTGKLIDIDSNLTIIIPEDGTVEYCEDTENDECYYYIADGDSASAEEVFIAAPGKVPEEKIGNVILGGVTMENGKYLAVDAQEVTETKPETVGYAYYADGVLTLHDYVYEGTGYLYDEEYNYTSALYTEGVLEIALEGDSSLTNTEEEGSGITSGGNLTIRGDGSLSINAYYGIDAEEKVNLTISGGTVDIEATGDAGINMQGGDMTIRDSTLKIYIDYWYGIYLEDGNLTVNDSTVDIEAAGDSGIRINSGDLTISDSIVNIDSEYVSGVLLNEGKLTVSGADAEVAVKSNGYAIQTGELIDIDSNLTIIIPEDGTVEYCEDTENDECYYYIADGDSASADEVFIAAPGKVPEEKIGNVILGGVTMENGKYLAVDAQEVTETKPETVGYAYYVDGVLTLHDYVYEGTSYLYDEEYNYTSALYTEGMLEIVLEGDSSLTNTEADGDCITLGGNLTIRGDGSLLIDAAYGIYADDRANLTISGITLNIETEEYDSICIEDGDITISDGSTVNCKSGYDSIDLEKGDLKISDSTVESFSSGGNGIDLENGSLTISDSIVDIETEEYDSIIIEGGDITISGSKVNVKSPYDGIDIYNGDLKLSDSTVNIKSIDEGIDHASGDVIISNSIINIESEDGSGIEVEEGSLTVSGSDTRMNVVSDEAAIYVFDPAGMTGISIESGLSIRSPENGEIFMLEEAGTYFYCVTDGNGDLAEEVFIGAEEGCSEHTWSQDYEKNDTHHWRFCTTENCWINDYPERCEGYALHGYGSDCTTGSSCGICGYASAETKDSHVDESGNGVCDNCEYVMDGMSVVAGYDICLTGEIAVNFYMKLEEEVTDTYKETAYMLFTLPNGTQQKVAVKDITETQGYYIFTCGVAAKEMTGDITAQLFLSEEDEQDGNGGTIYTYSVERYADVIQKDSTGTYDSDDKAMVIAMLNYGAYSQEYFDYATDEPANDDVIFFEQRLPEVTGDDLDAYAAQITNPDNICTFTSASLVLKSETQIKVRVQLADGIDPVNDEVKFYINGTELSTEEYTMEGDYYVLKLTGISANKLDTMSTFKVTASNDREAKLSYGALTYCRTVLNQPDTTENEALKNVVKALYAYNQAANAYN